MPSYLKYTFACFICFLLIVAGAMVGATLYESHIAQMTNVDFWAKWTAIAGIFGVVAAILVAVYTDIKVDIRFGKQIDTQIKLDKNADERQQTEWSRSAMKKKEDIEFFNEKIMRQMAAENQELLKRTQEMLKKIYAQLSNKQTVMLPVDFYYPFRPAFERLISRVEDIDYRTMIALQHYEGKTSSYIIALNVAYKGDKTRLLNVWEIALGLQRELEGYVSYLLSEHKGSSLIGPTLNTVYKNLGFNMDEIIRINDDGVPPQTPV